MRDLSPLEIEKWYAVAVGEIGIPPSEFYEMTEDEMLWAHRGYKQRQQDLANIMLLALKKIHSNHKDELFSFVERKGYDIGNLAHRQKTFAALGVKEE